ncbi:MAG: type II secretion system protein [Planctomycetaceae bacterium]
MSKLTNQRRSDPPQGRAAHTTLMATQRRRGFTLPELLISVSVSGLLMVSLGSALNIATRSLRPDAAAAVSLDSGRSLRMIQEDLRFATRIIDRGPRSIRMLTTDADRSGKGDIVFYSWSGTVGDSLTRSVNGSTAIPVCEDVADFNIALSTRGETQQIPEPSAPTTESLFHQQTSTSSLDWETADSSNAYGQLISPSLFLSTAKPEADDEWQITRVEYYAARLYSWGGSTYRFELDRATDDGLPTHDVLYTENRDPSIISSSGGWTSISISGLPWLDASQNVAMSFTHNSGLNHLVIPIRESSGVAGYLGTDESTSQWLRPAGQRSLVYRVYGRIRSKSHDDQDEPLRRFQTAELRLAASALGGTPMYAAAEFLNKPLDATTVAETDFANYSITDDSNFDGSADWVLSTTGSGNSSTVSSGLWTATNQAIQLTPAIPPGVQTEIEVSGRDTTSSTGSVMIRAAGLQSAGGDSISVLATLSLQSNGTQALVLYEETSTNTFTKCDQFTMLNSSRQDIRLVLNPVRESVALWVNGIFLKSCRVSLIETPALASTVQVQASGNACEFGFCKVLTRTLTTSETVLP